MTKIVVDAMGGDYAPKQQVLGCVKALNKDKDLYLILCGDETQIKAELANCKYDESRLEIRHTTETISMEEDPMKAVKNKKDASMVVAFRLLKEDQADGLVCSGSTGAVITAATLILRRLKKGAFRPALCPIIPNYRGEGTFLCDCGANLNCAPLNLAYFALMASVYAQAAYGVENPRVGLLNNGTEDHKGDELHQQTHALLQKIKEINYVGNVEGRDLMYGEIDVMVADGFTGNIAMKAVEGCGKAVSTILKREYKRNLWTKIRAGISMDIIDNIKNGLDYEGFGGAMLLGFGKTVVKGHGNAKERGFAVCIEQAANAVRGGMVGKIQALLDSVDLTIAETGTENA